MTGLAQNEPVADEDFVYFHDAKEAIRCFMDCCDQWIYSFDGAAALDINGVMPVIKLYRSKPRQQLTLLREVKAFAAGVLQYRNEQKLKNAK